MRVSNGLAGSLANVHAHVIAVRHTGGFDVAPNCENKSPNGGLFITGEREKVGLVPPRNNQAMPLIQRKGVGKRHGEVIRGNEVAASQ
jgi:hypothetical protein